MSAGREGDEVAGPVDRAPAARARTSQSVSLRAMPRGAHRLAWIFAAIVSAGLALRPWVGDELLVTRYTGYVMPWLLAGLLPGASWAWCARRRALAAVLGLSAAVVVAVHVPRFRPRAAVAPRGETLEVMSYNTWSKNADARGIARVIEAQRPDVLLMQEIPPEVFERVVESLQHLYGGGPVHRAYDPEIQQAVLSRYPLEARASMPDKGQTQRVVLHSPAGPITVFNVHPLRTGGWRQRYRQIAALLEEDVLPARAPVILGGDLNVTEHSQLYALVARHLRNAHDAAGFGLGFTYPAAARVLATVPLLPMARIDHVFFSGHFVVVRAGTLQDAGGSDHRPVFAAVILQGAGPPGSVRRRRDLRGRTATARSRGAASPGRASRRAR